MNQIKQPTKEDIRQWLRDRQLNPGPLPTVEQIKSELGWNRPATREGKNAGRAFTALALANIYLSRNRLMAQMRP